jgi:hypothetical protein
MGARLSAIQPSLRPLAHLGADYLYELAPDVESADVTVRSARMVRKRFVDCARGEIRLTDVSGTS